jgi:DNA-binding FadR family transcriptional regulator
MNETIVARLEAGLPHEAAAEMETYLNLAERTMLKALERACEPA